MPSILKTCSKCNLEKPISEFYRNRSKRGGHESSCKACTLHHVKKYYTSHREERLMYARKYRQQNPDKVYEVKRKWRLANPEREKDRVDKWKKDNPERVRAIIHRRRARKQSNGGIFTKSEWHDLCAMNGNRCLSCGAIGKLTVDHVIPISCGGSNDIGNIQPLCKPCNLRKGTKTIDYCL